MESIYHAVWHGDLERVRELVEDHGVNVNVRDENNWSPILCASAYDHLSVLKFLVQNGANVDSTGRMFNSMTTPLEMACFNGHYAVVLFLLNHGANVNHGRLTPLHNACEGGRLRIAQLLLACGADLATTDPFGKTPLHSACLLGRLPLVRLLLAHGANMSATDQIGKTPLHSACMWGRLSLIQLLLAQGANMSATDQFGRTPLHCAQDEGHHEEVHYLESVTQARHCHDLVLYFVQEGLFDREEAP